MTDRVDVFMEVHKGIRNALFHLSLTAGSADATDPGDIERLCADARDTFRFLEHHARNEDNFLVPEMRAKGLPEAERMAEGHEELECRLRALAEAASALPRDLSGLHGFYLDLNRFISAYLRHMDEEETRILPLLHLSLTDGELEEFPRRSVAATGPGDQSMMLAYMLPAMNRAELSGFFARVRGKAPRETILHLEGIARRVLGERGAAILAG